MADYGPVLRALAYFITCCCKRMFEVESNTSPAACEPLPRSGVTMYRVKLLYM